MTVKTTPALVRKAFAAAGYAGVTFHRSPSGYYYFGGDGIWVLSLYWFNLDGSTAQDVVDHVREYL